MYLYIAFIFLFNTQKEAKIHNIVLSNVRRCLCRYLCYLMPPIEFYHYISGRILYCSFRVLLYRTNYIPFNDYKKLYHRCTILPQSNILKESKENLILYGTAILQRIN